MTVAEPAQRWEHRPHLDGLRAVAVYLVLAFHAGVGRAAGGFIGVDVFFVLSGFLVTSLLLRDLHGRGRIRLGRFYARRVRRLLPAALVNLVVTALVFRWIARPTELADIESAVRAAALYVSNWWFIGQSTDYFGANVAASPVNHYWSLSVEEQFYVAWPLLLLALAALAGVAGRWRSRVLAGLVAALALASLVGALVVAGDGVSRAYYGTFTRAYQLLAGALLALAPAVVGRARRLSSASVVWPAVAVGALGALVVLATDVVALGPISRGIGAATAAVALIMALEAVAAGPAHRLLAAGPLTYLGRISYGTYLWHWLVILVLVREHDTSPVVTLAIAAPVATAVAAASYHLMERPIRTSVRLDRLGPVVIAIGLALSALVGLVVAPVLLDAGGATPSPADADRRGTPVGADWREAKADEPELTPCDLDEEVVCTLVEGDGPKVLLVGDSHAAMFAPALSGVAKRRGLELSAAFLPFCPWVRGIKYPLIDDGCFANQQELFTERIPAYEPDLVVLVHRAIDDPLSPLAVADRDEGPLYLDEQRDAAVARRTRATVAGLRKRGIAVVIVEPIPMSAPEDTPIDCLAEEGIVEPCRFRASASPRAQEEVFRQADADDDQVWSLDVDRDVCPRLPICDPVVDGRIVLYDSNHLTTAFSETLADPIDRWMTANGVLDG